MSFPFRPAGGSSKTLEEFDDNPTKTEEVSTLQQTHFGKAAHSPSLINLFRDFKAVRVQPDGNVFKVCVSEQFSGAAAQFSVKVSERF